MSETPSRLHGLDVLRAVAIAAVFLFHYQRLFDHPEWMETAFGFGWTGVDLFFVLSGYLIASQLLRELSTNGRLQFDVFYIKRCFRILPPFLFVLLIYATIPWTHEREALAPLYRYLTFTLNLGLDETVHGTFSHAWSLCIEEQFYLVLPILLSLVIWKKLPRIAVGVFVAGLLIRGVSYEVFVADQSAASFLKAFVKWIYYPTQCRLDGLTVGVLIAWAFRYQPSLKSWLVERHRLLFWLGAALFGIAATWQGKFFVFSVFGFPLVSVAFGLMVVAAISPTSAVYRTNSTLVRWVADLSYSVYLCHKITCHVTQKVLSDWGIPTDGIGVLVICVLSTAVFSLGMHLLIERPSASLKVFALQRLTMGRDVSKMPPCEPADR